MKIKLEKLFNMQTSLNRITNLELEPKISYRLSKILKKVIAELKDLEEQRQKLLTKYAVETFDDKGEKTGKKVPDDKLEVFTAEWMVLLQEEVELEGVAKVAWSDSVKLTAKEVMDLEDILEINE